MAEYIDIQAHNFLVDWNQEVEELHEMFLATCPKTEDITDHLVTLLVEFARYAKLKP